jgi:adenine deaminase
MIDEPFMTISFVTLAVVPELKLTDLGLFNVNTFKFVNLFAV